MGSELALDPPLSLRHSPPFKETYVWFTVRDGRIKGAVQGNFSTNDNMVELRQCADGIHWYFGTLTPDLTTESEAERVTWLENIRRHGVVFYTHPRHHRFPWSVDHALPNESIGTKVSRLAFTLHKRQLVGGLKTFLRRIESC